MKNNYNKKNFIHKKNNKMGGKFKKKFKYYSKPRRNNPINKKSVNY